MTNNLLRAGALSCALMASTALSSPALAQPHPLANMPRAETLDQNGVDVIRRSFVLGTTDMTIGAGAGELRLERRVDGEAFRGASNVSASMEPIFTFSSFVAIPNEGGHYIKLPHRNVQITSTLDTSLGGTFDQANNVFTETDGTIFRFNHYSGTPEDNNIVAFLTQITRPDGTVTNIHWAQDSYTDTGGTYHYDRVQSVTNNHGYMLKFEYAADVDPRPGATSFDELVAGRWNEVRRVRAVNRNYETCDPDANLCTFVGAWPSTEFSFPANQLGIRTQNGTMTVTRPAGEIVTYTQSGANLQIAHNGVAAVSIAYPSTSTMSVTRLGSTWTYERLDSLGERLRVTDMLGNSIVYRQANQLLDTITDQNNQVTDHDYDSVGRLQRITSPLGNSVEFDYDGRSNLTEMRRIAAPGSGLADTVVTATYAPSCAGNISCNEPLTVTDARNNVTEYSYDAVHGALRSVTSPPATPQTGVRAQTRYDYAPVNGIQMLAAVSECRTQQASLGGAPAACIGTDDEVRTVIQYGANNLPTQVTTSAGDGSPAESQAFTYDAVGNVLTGDGPLPGSDDTTRFRYDAARRIIGEISADPDGAGALPHRGTRITRRPDGQAMRIETGSVASQDESALASMAAEERTEIGFDSFGRPVSQHGFTQNVRHSVAQTSYDALGRPDCEATRMDPSDFASSPQSACVADPTPSAQYGPDRISRRTYTPRGQVDTIRDGVGVTGPNLEGEVASRSTYTNNGELQTLADGAGNVTAYSYDGHRRLSHIHHPPESVGAGVSSTGDYEQFGYDAEGNVTSARTRAAQTLIFAYDALNRPTSRNLPGNEPDVTYGYDLLGRMTSVGHPSTPLTFTYDALGRETSQAGVTGTITSTYDAAGRRIGITYPGGFSIEQDYLTTGEMRRVREAGATSGPGVLAEYQYDGFGRRTRIFHGNGTRTDYSYGPAGRLATLQLDLGGTAYDQTVSLGYNPAGQIVSRHGTNDAFVSAGPGTPASDTPNGLNQIRQRDGTMLTYDGNGNLTSDGARSYGYSSDNLLTSSGGASFGYDGLSRLSRIDGSGAQSGWSFTRDGGRLMAMHGPAGAQQRHVFAPETRELVAWYRPGRSFTHSDERGSIVAVTSDSGNVIGINRYDEHGAPGAGNLGWLQYAGQQSMSDVPLHYSGARFYNYRLGRFNQPDPIGYADGMNRYAYAGNDPVNRVDPTGLFSEPSGPYTGPTWRGEDQYIKGRRRRGNPALERFAGSALVSPGVGCVGSFADIQDYCFREQERREQAHPYVALVREPMTYGGSGFMRGEPRGSLVPSPRRPGYCGSGWNEPFVPDRGPGANFAQACATHDRCYASSATQAQCDIELYNNMNAECRNGSRRAGCYAMAYTYYRALKGLGSSAYKDAQRSRRR